METSVGTSDSHPIRVDFVSLPETIPGKLGMTFAPGKVQPVSVTGMSWKRDVSKDLHVLKNEFNTTTLVSLMEDREYKEVRLTFEDMSKVFKFRNESLFEKVKEYKIEHISFPITDNHVPQSFTEFHKLVEEIVAKLTKGETVVVHCLGGLGRTGTVVACCIILLAKEFKDEMTSASVIKMVRAARKGTVQSYQQVLFVEEFAKKNNLKS